MTKSTKSKAPFGWHMSGGKPDDYEGGIDGSVSHSGTRCAYMKHAVERPQDFATLMQQMSANNFLGKRVRMTGWLKTRDVHFWASLWMSVYGAEGRENVSFDNMCERKITGTHDWTKCEIVLDVPTDGSKIGFGAILASTGQLWFDDISFDVVTEDVDVTDCICSDRRRKMPELSLTPRNLNFEHDDG